MLGTLYSCTIVTILKIFRILEKNAKSFQSLTVSDKSVSSDTVTTRGRGDNCHHSRPESVHTLQQADNITAWGRGNNSSLQGRSL